MKKEAWLCLGEHHRGCLRKGDEVIDEEATGVVFCVEESQAGFGGRNNRCVLGLGKV